MRFFIGPRYCEMVYAEQGLSGVQTLLVLSADADADAAIIPKLVEYGSHIVRLCRFNLVDAVVNIYGELTVAEREADVTLPAPPQLNGVGGEDADVDNAIFGG